MDALILAAGFGSRLREEEPCKPLTNINGLSLLEISVRQLITVGVTRVVVATGYCAELVESACQDISERVGIPIITRRVSDFSKPNGHSILAAEAALSDHFLLVMADHILSAEILQGLAEEPVQPLGATLAIDRRISSERVDPDDATWVETIESGQIYQIGKGIERYNAVDCGAFHATRGLIDAIQAAIAKGKSGSLSEGMQELADHGLASTYDIDGAWWIDVDEAQSLRMARDQVKLALPRLFDAGIVAPARAEALS